MQPSALVPGTRLAGRYLVTEAHGVRLGVESWCAVDELLRRRVGVETLPSDDPRAEAFAAAALAAARVTDPRFLHVLDVSDEDGVLYVVREWSTATTLADLVRGEPLAPAAAAHLACEVADALSAAHQAGLAHLHLRPERVFQSDAGGVKVAGLAVDAALANEPSAEEPGDVDARGCGAILYTALTGHWPDTSRPVAAAPPENGHVLRPRQVRAGIPATLDALCMRALGVPSDAGPVLRTPEEVAIALRTVVVTRDAQSRPPYRPGLPTTTLAPALLAPSGATRRPDMPPPGPVPRRLGPAMRFLRTTVAGVLIVALALVAWQVAAALQDDGSDPAKPVGEPSAASAAVPVRDVSDFDPYGQDGNENPEQVDNAVDGDSATAWTTSSYYRRPDLGGLKPGVGLVLDLGEVRDVSRVEVDLGGSGTDLELRAAPEDAASAPTTHEEYAVVAAESGAGAQSRLEPDTTVRTRYLLVWLTTLPPEGSDYRGSVSEVRVFG